MNGRELANRYFDAQAWLASFDDMNFAARMGRSLGDKMHMALRESGMYRVITKADMTR